MIKDMPLLVFIVSLFECFVQLSLSLIILKQKNYRKKLKFWISIFALACYVSLSYLVTDNVCRIIIFFIIGCGLIKLIVRNEKSFNNIVLSTFSVWLMEGIADVLSYIILIGILKMDMELYRSNVLLFYFNTCIILLIQTLIFYIKPIRKFITKISNANLKKSTLIILSLSAFMFSVIFYLCIFNFPKVYILIVSLIMVVIYTIVTLLSISITNQKNKIKTEYDILLTNLSEYENLLDRQRILNHENKNQLLVIRGMIDKKEDSVKYIDTLIETQYKYSEELIMRTNRIPSGGLKGLIYYKMLNMKDRKINVGLEVVPSINKIDFTSIPIRTIQELCKIIGVFLDNAMQEVENLDDRNINIIFENENNNLIVRIANNYSSDVSKIGDKGYTTKGSGHGYGLRLVKNIIDGNKSFEHKTEVSGKVFSQIVKLRIKN